MSSSISLLPTVYQPVISSLPAKPYKSLVTDVIQNNIINKKVRIVLTDSRIYVGTVYCLDGNINIILDNVQWVRAVNNDTNDNDNNDNKIIKQNVPHCLFAFKYIKSITLLYDSKQQQDNVESILDHTLSIIK